MNSRELLLTRVTPRACAWAAIRVSWRQSAEVVAIVVGTIVTALTEGWAMVLIGITVGLISAEITVVPQLIAQELASGTQVAIPAHIRSFVSNAIAPISWIGGGSLGNPKLVIGSDMLVTGKLSTA